MKSNIRKALVPTTLLFIVAFSLCALTGPAAAETGNPIEENSKPTAEFIDFSNGTTQTIIDYGNGSNSVIRETFLMKTAKLKLGKDTTGQSLSVSLPTSEEESTDYVTVYEDAVLEQEVLMGFTYQLVAWHWSDSWDVLIAEASAGIDVDIGFGLRLPVRIALEYPEQMTVEHDYELYATLTPLDRPDYNEFKCTFQAMVWASAEIFGVDAFSFSFGPNYDYSKSFTTPLGPAMEFPIPSLERTVFDSAWVIGFSLLKLNLVIDPELGSDKITARASAAGDASADQTLRWSVPDDRIPFTVHADDYGPTDFAEIELSDFRYYFTKFKVHFKLKFDFHDWIDWLTGNPTLTLFTLDMSWLTEGLYIGVHEGTDPTVDVTVFVKKFGVDLVVTPSLLDIIPGDTGTFDILVINRGNVPDTFDLSLLGLPPPWSYEFSSTEVSVDVYASVSIQLFVEPYRHWSTSPGDYPFTVTGTSQQAPLHDLAATDTESATVHVLPFYEPDLTITSTTVTVEPSDAAVYIIEVTNLGNVRDGFDISLIYIDFDGAYRADPPSIQPAWTNIDKTSLTLDPGGSDTATLSITVPSDWAGIEDATYEFTATATSTTNPTASDTETAELTVQTTKESKTRYIGLEIESLTDEVRDSAICDEIKSSLLDKLTNATKKYEQALDYILEGRIKIANNMLKACKQILSVFINEVEAQKGKCIPAATADDWIAKAETIISDIENAIATSI